MSANLLRTLRTPGVNDVVQLTFWPTGGGFYSTKVQKIVGCPSKGNDKDCIGDQYESCLLSEFCGGPRCPAKEQLQLAEFLECFEHQHDANMSFADSCATTAGFDTAKLHECFDDDTSRLAAWNNITNGAKATGQVIGCFPWVVLNDKVISTDPEEGCLGENAGTYDLLQAFCNASFEAGSEIAAVCSPKNATLAESFLM